MPEAGPWEAAILPFPSSVGERPGSRFCVALVTAGGVVVHHEVLTDALGRIEDVADALDAALLQAERRAGTRPPSVHVRHRDVARALAVRQAHRGVEVRAVRRMPDLEAAARSLAQHLTGQDILPLTSSAPTWRGWGLSEAQARALFAAAARFYRAAPWARMDGILTGFVAGDVWTVAVMGGAVGERGLAIYTERSDHEALGHDEDVEAVLEDLEGAVLSLSFEERGLLTREMQREVVSAGWEVADPHAYPFLLATNTPAGGLDPAVVDGIVSVLLAVPDLADALDAGLGSGLGGRRVAWEHAPTGLHFSYEMEGGFTWPGTGHLAPGAPLGPGADPGARVAPCWEPDAPWEDEPVVEAFLASLRGSVSDATAERHGRNATELVAFLNGLQGVPLRAMHESDLRTFLYDAFPRSRPGYTRAEALSASLRKLFAFLEETRGVTFPWAEALLRDRASLLRRVDTAPLGGWWDEDVQAFRADLFDDLDRRVMLLPDDWAGALESQPFMGREEARLHQEAQRTWLAWRDELIGSGVGEAPDLIDSLGERLLSWLDAPDPGDAQGPEPRTRLEVIRAERSAFPPEGA